MDKFRNVISDVRATNLLRLAVIFWTLLHQASCDIKRLRVQPLNAARLHGNARIVCNFQGTDLDIQYITWTKEFIGGGDVYVYGYDACANENSAYGILRNRALLDIAQPTSAKHVRRALSDDDVIGSSSNDTLSYDAKRSVFANEGSVDITNVADMHVGSAALTIQDVRLEDEARYRCLVKTRDAPAESHAQLLIVIALPQKPTIQALTSFMIGRNVTLWCAAHLGRPTGRIHWLIKHKTKTDYSLLPANMSVTSLHHHQNGTSSANSSLTLHVTSQHRDAVVRCEASSRAMKPWEQRLKDEIQINILSKPSNGRVDFDVTTNTYHCQADGNPQPTYIWVWMHDDGSQTILSTDQVLDVSRLKQNGVFQFHCLASNVIENQRHNIIIKTSVDLTAPPLTTATTTTAPLFGERRVTSPGSQGRSNTVRIDDPYVWANDVPKPMQINKHREVIPIWDVVVSQIDQSIGNYDMSAQGRRQDASDLEPQQTADLQPIEIKVTDHTGQNQKMENWNESVIKNGMKVTMENWDEHGMHMKGNATDENYKEIMPKTLFTDENLLNVALENQQLRGQQTTDVVQNVTKLPIQQNAELTLARNTAPTSPRNTEPTSRRNTEPTVAPTTVRYESSVVPSTPVKLDAFRAENLAAAAAASGKLIRQQARKRTGKYRSGGRNSASKFDEFASNDLSIDNLPQNVPYFESDIEKLVSPDNYDYEDLIDTNSNDVVTSSSQSRANSKVTSSTRRNTATGANEQTQESATQNVTITTKKNKAPLKVYLGDLLSRRFSVDRLRDDRRPRGRAVPLSNNRQINFAKLTRGMPTSTRRSLRRRLTLMNKNLRIILQAYDRGEINSNMADNARELPAAYDEPIRFENADEYLPPHRMYPDYSDMYYDYPYYDELSTNDVIGVDENSVAKSEAFLNHQLHLSANDAAQSRDDDDELISDGYLSNMFVTPHSSANSGSRPATSDVIHSHGVHRNALNGRNLAKITHNSAKSYPTERKHTMAPFEKSHNSEEQHFHHDKLPIEQQPSDLLSDTEITPKLNSLDFLSLDEIKQKFLTKQLMSDNDEDSEETKLEKLQQIRQLKQRLSRLYTAERNSRELRHVTGDSVEQGTREDFTSFDSDDSSAPGDERSLDSEMYSLAEMAARRAKEKRSKHHHSDHAPRNKMKVKVKNLKPKRNLGNLGNSEKFGIYEVESKLNPRKYKPVNSRDLKSFNTDKKMAENLVKNSKVFSPSNHQTANAFSSLPDAKEGSELRHSVERGFRKSIERDRAVVDLEQKDINEYSNPFESVVKTVGSEFDCSTREAGSHGGGCRSFYKCIDGVTYRVECKSPHVFNSRTNNCDVSSNAPSPCGDWRDCASRLNGKYADTDRRCRYYFTCFKGLFLGHNKCNHGLVFNEKRQVCDWPEQTPKPCGEN